MNLGKTITLPGSVASFNVAGRTCANAGAASANAGTSSPASRAFLVLNFMMSTFSIRHQIGDLEHAKRVPRYFR
jgi:hypothetical protein